MVETGKETVDGEARDACCREMKRGKGAIWPGKCDVMRCSALCFITDSHTMRLVPIRIRGLYKMKTREYE
jgi:hypothetical protein